MVPTSSIPEGGVSDTKCWVLSETCAKWIPWQSQQHEGSYMYSVHVGRLSNYQYFSFPATILLYSLPSFGFPQHLVSVGSTKFPYRSAISYLWCSNTLPCGILCRSSWHLPQLSVACGLSGRPKAPCLSLVCQRALPTRLLHIPSWCFAALGPLLSAYSCSSSTNKKDSLTWILSCLLWVPIWASWMATYAGRRECRARLCFVASRAW